MDLKSPKEIVADVSYMTDEKKRKAFMLKTQASVQGAFWGGAIGLMFAFYKDHNKYTSALLGAGIGALISNILTVKK
jgi:uncharacterized membrane protein